MQPAIVGEAAVVDRRVAVEGDLDAFVARGRGARETAGLGPHLHRRIRRTGDVAIVHGLAPELLEFLLLRPGRGSRGDLCARQPARGLATLDPADSAPQQGEQCGRSGDVDNRGRERDPPHADAVEDQVEHGVQHEVRERDRGRHPVRLEAEESAVQHQHRAVEDEAGAERRERSRDDGRLSRRERTALKQQADDRLGEHRADDCCGCEQKRDLPQPGADRRAKAVDVPIRRVARERREEDRRDRDREHSLREHVDEKGLLDRRGCERGVDQSRREEGVDHGVHVDQAEAERHRHHQREDALDGRIAPVEHELQPSVATAQPRHRQEDLDERRDDDRHGVDVQLGAHRLRLRHADHQADDDRDVPEHRRQRGHREVVVGVEDPDDDPGDAEQRHDREEHAGEADCKRLVVAGIAEESDDPRGDEDEERGQCTEPEQHQPEEARRDAPGALSLALLEQFAEHRDERGRERRVGDERTHQVRHLKCDRERVDLASRAEVVGGDDLADEPEDPGEAGGGAEDERRANQALAVCPCSLPAAWRSAS